MKPGMAVNTSNLVAERSNRKIKSSRPAWTIKDPVFKNKQGSAKAILIQMRMLAANHRTEQGEPNERARERI